MRFGTTTCRSGRFQATRFQAGVILVVVLSLALIATACGGGESGTGTTAGGPQASDQIRDDQVSLSVPKLGGGEFDFASIQGKNTVLWFWAPWCTSCRAESPNVVAAAAEFDGSVQVIGVAGRGEIPDMDRFVTDTGTGGFDHIVDRDGSLWSQYNVVSQPAFAFISASGDVEVFVGTLGRKGLTERMQALAST
jgi:thiol-disulfide isomerase/thioredoxin